MNISSNGTHQISRASGRSSSAIYVSGSAGGAILQLVYINEQGTEVALLDGSGTTNKEPNFYAL